MTAGDTQHPRNNLILHLAPRAREKWTKQYGDKLMDARGSITMFCLIFSLIQLRSYGLILLWYIRL